MVQSLVLDKCICEAVCLERGQTQPRENYCGATLIKKYQLQLGKLEGSLLPENEIGFTGQTFNQNSAWAPAIGLPLPTDWVTSEKFGRKRQECGATMSAEVGGSDVTSIQDEELLRRMCPPGLTESWIGPHAVHEPTVCHTCSDKRLAGERTGIGYLGLSATSHGGGPLMFERCHS
uniref:Uncharacterized protein n=1 Tax=Timema poppense TaxID=170557 RepID=A0A7R9CNR6_TIMPO|nr:unnamed protein product [Timema poppensis]